MATTVESGTSYTIYSAGSSDTSFSIAFPYISVTHVALEINGITAQYGADYTVNTGTTEVDLDASLSLTTGDRVKVYRSTPFTAPLRSFVGGSVLTEEALDVANKQVLYALQEFLDRSGVGTNSPGTGSSNPYYEFSVTDAAVAAYSIPLEFNMENSPVYLNGQLMDRSDYTITTGSLVSTLTLTPDLVVGDVVTVWRITGEVSLSVSSNSVGSSALQDDSVTLSKLDFVAGADNRIININTSGDPSLVERFAARLDQWTAPTSDVAMGSQKVTGLAAGTTDTDGVNKGQMDTAVSTAKFNVTGVSAATPTWGSSVQNNDTLSIIVSAYVQASADNLWPALQVSSDNSAWTTVAQASKTGGSGHGYATHLHACVPAGWYYRFIEFVNDGGSPGTSSSGGTPTTRSAVIYTFS